MYIWLDLETTGLDSTDDSILEIGMVATTDQAPYEEVDCFSGVVYWDGDKSKLNQWVQKTHTDSGLFELCSLSSHGLRVVEDQAVEFVVRHSVGGKRLMAGSSIHFDRTFIKNKMKRLDQAFHYRCFDISGTSEYLAWSRPDIFAGMREEAAGSNPGAVAHRALDDIRNSLQQWRVLNKRLELIRL